MALIQLLNKQREDLSFRLKEASSNASESEREMRNYQKLEVHLAQLLCDVDMTIDTMTRPENARLLQVKNDP